MKRILIFLSAVCAFIIANPAISAFAAENGANSPSNVTITVVVPDSTPAPTPEPIAAPTPEPIKMYPVDVTETIDGGVRQIVKTYELNANEQPDDIPRADFVRSAGTSGASWKYTLTDILRKETASTDTCEHTETVTLNTDTKDIEKILPLFSQTMEYKSEDGYVGVLTLDVASIKVETAGTKTTSYTMNVTREYPHLSTNDSSLVPKTTTDNGKTYTLVGIEWKPLSVEVVDYEQVPTSYTAVATYSATGSSTKVTGYVTTAEYKGTLTKLTEGRPVYTAYFIGEEIRTPLEMTNLPSGLSVPQTIKPTEPPTTEAATTEATQVPSVTEAPTATISPTDKPTATDDSVATDNSAPPDDSKTKDVNPLYIAIPIIGAIAGVAYYFTKKKKGVTK